MEGLIDATTEQAALERLTGQGVTTTHIELGGGGDDNARARGEALGQAWRRRRVPVTVITLFVRELATMVHADIPLLECLGVMRRQEEHSAFRVILEDVFERVKGGEAFSKALTAHPTVFPTLLVSMVRVGEMGGMLGPVLDQMANWMEYEEEVRGEIRGAMAYPLMIVALGIVTLFILVGGVLPRITVIFTGMEAQLPLPTKILMGLAAFMGRWWWTVLLGVAIIVVAVMQLSKTPIGRRWIDRLSLSMPFLGSLILNSAIARFARANAALLAAGVPLLEALQVVRGLLGNVLIVEMVDHAIGQVTRGGSLAKVLSETPYFPPAVVHMLGVGERTGRLGEMFERVASRFERRMRARIKTLLGLLAPLMIIILAVFVALIAISILLPIFRMNRLMR